MVSFSSASHSLTNAQFLLCGPPYFCSKSFFLFRHFPNTDLLGSTQVKSDMNLSLSHSGSAWLSSSARVCHRVIPGYFTEIQAQLRSVTHLE